MPPTTAKRTKFISAPLINADDKISKTKKSRKNKKKIRPDRGVVYFSHIPHGFYEEEIKQYCSQFGKVTGLYLPRSKNGNSRGYAFVEFKNPDVAQIVADTMNNYLMFNRLIKAKYIPPEQQRPGVIRRGKYWSNKTLYLNRKSETLESMTRKLTPEEEVTQQKKIRESIDRYHKQLQALGLDYDFMVEDVPLPHVKEEKKKSNKPVIQLKEEVEKEKKKIEPVIQVNKENVEKKKRKKNEPVNKLKNEDVKRKKNEPVIQVNKKEVEKKKRKQNEPVKLKNGEVKRKKNEPVIQIKTKEIERKRKVKKGPVFQVRKDGVEKKKRKKKNVA